MFQRPKNKSFGIRWKYDNENVKCVFSDALKCYSETFKVHPLKELIACKMTYIAWETFNWIETEDCYGKAIIKMFFVDKIVHSKITCERTVFELLLCYKMKLQYLSSYNKGIKVVSRFTKNLSKGNCIF